ncbi:hypothetical protein GCM10023347_07610 [Streptomyces chumphonensis]|uniref:Uncharacterized protein n=1 Tax=Streptomyces chumphonensis TaxID=1214925 RepID=A0A927F666_9ACTN|nr:hypothetical protein [Streptomyces chumphonensis]MBD3934849.1 hypothetical protein [Streptomyces chumphonensis]
MITTISRPALGEEPEPQHDRPADVPPALPPLPQREPGRTLHATGSLVEDLEHEDDQRGYEPEPDARHRALGQELLRRVRAGDRIAAAAGRTAPRTVAQKRERLAAVGGAR